MGRSSRTHLIATTPVPQKTASLVMDGTIAKAGLSSIEELDYIVGTGYGRLKVGFATRTFRRSPATPAAPTG